MFETKFGWSVRAEPSSWVRAAVLNHGRGVLQSHAESFRGSQTDTQSHHSGLVCRSVNALKSFAIQGTSWMETRVPRPHLLARKIVYSNLTNYAERKLAQYHRQSRTALSAAWFPTGRRSHCSAHSRSNVVKVTCAMTQIILSTSVAKRRSIADVYPMELLPAVKSGVKQ